MKWRFVRKQNPFGPWFQAICLRIVTSLLLDTYLFFFRIIHQLFHWGLHQELGHLGWWPAFVSLSLHEAIALFLASRILRFVHSDHMCMESSPYTFFFCIICMFGPFRYFVGNVFCVLVASCGLLWIVWWNLSICGCRKILLRIVGSGCWFLFWCLLFLMCQCLGLGPGFLCLCSDLMFLLLCWLVLSLFCIFVVLICISSFFVFSFSFLHAIMKSLLLALLIIVLISNLQIAMFEVLISLFWCDFVQWFYCLFCCLKSDVFFSCFFLKIWSFVSMFLSSRPSFLFFIIIL